MKYLWKCFLAAAALSLQAVPAMAQEAKPAAPVAIEAPSVNCCGNDCCDSGCKSGGIIGGIEFLLLKPYNSEGNAPVFDEVIEIINEVSGIAGLGVGINEPEYDHEPSFRLWGGYQGASGLGARLTYFHFDSSAEAVTNIAVDGGFVDIGLNYAVEAKTLDLEIIQSFNPNCNWNFLLGAGYRWAQYKETNSLSLGVRPPAGQGDPVSLPNLLSSGFDSDNHGLTVSGEARRRLGNFALFLGARSSILFGDENEFFSIGLPVEEIAFVNQLLSEEEKDNIKFLYELRMGGEWNREMSNGSVLFARLTAEAQYWDNVTGVPILNSSASFGLFGIGLGAGIYR